MARTDYNILFYSCAHNGDVHVSRELVKYVMRRVEAPSYTYCHGNSPRLLLDIPGLKYRNANEVAGLNPYAQYCLPTADALALNTWYAASPSQLGCSLNTLYALFDTHVRSHFGIGIEDPIETFVPTIDFSYYEIGGIDAFLAQVGDKYRSKVLVSNGETLSGQTRMPAGAFEEVVRAVATAHPEVLFFVTNRGPGYPEASNVVYTRDVIGLPDGVNDLCENAYIGTRCDVIVGRGSGAYTFSYLKDNFFSPHRTMLCFTDEVSTANWVYPQSAVQARMLWSRDYRTPEMIQLFEKALNRWT